MKLLTKEILEANGADPSDVVLFAKEWPDGCDGTVADSQRLAKLDLNINWLAVCFLVGSERIAYKEATAPAKKAYEEALAPARKVYEEARASSLKVYEEAKAPALKVYEEAKAPAWKTYHEAKATALFRALQLRAGKGGQQPQAQENDDG